MRTAEEYRKLMLDVFSFKESEVVGRIDKSCDAEDSYNAGYLNGYLSGLIEAKRTINASEFLTK